MQARLTEKLETLHLTLQMDHPALTRIAVATYDEDTDKVKTFIHSTVGDSPLRHYEVRLADAPSLEEIAVSKMPRVWNELAPADEAEREHTRKVAEAGFRSSFTVPIYHEGRLYGFLFYDATEVGFFTPLRVHHLQLFTELISLFVVSEMLPIRTLKAAVRTALGFSRFRHEETGAHLDRMSRYTKLIALGLGDFHELDDEYIEFMYQFAPLHDIGKIGIPDEILLKPGELEGSERAIMQTHVTKGLEMIDAMLSNFGLKSIGHIEVMRNIVACHHEALDGSGYPDGLKGDQIPLEARIVSVADIFDALTSSRPYKKAWTNQQAFDYLSGLAGRTLDIACVHALISGADEVAAIQRRFPEDPYG